GRVVALAGGPLRAVHGAGRGYAGERPLGDHQVLRRAFLLDDHGQAFAGEVVGDLVDLAYLATLVAGGDPGRDQGLVHGVGDSGLQRRVEVGETEDFGGGLPRDVDCRTEPQASFG